ncbi:MULTISPECIES: TetR/AcrR family transcriptional regulator [unclassified Nocardia]|uniref:TetR/AcrR family transcriptional regulator n=1 Tax=unclassified Nocardia TaxID=2637762 RepID=UPI0035DF6217
MPDRNPLEDRILDAALERILLVGIRRASLDDIARHARVNRITIYRHFATKENLVDTVLAREAERALVSATEVGIATVGLETRIEQMMLTLFEVVRSHPIITRLAAAEPEDALAFYTVRGQQLVRTAISYVLRFVERGQELECLNRYDPAPVAELIARLTHSLLLTPSGGVDFDDVEQARCFVRRTIVPLLVRGIGTGDMTHSAPCER